MGSIHIAGKIQHRIFISISDAILVVVAVRIDEIFPVGRSWTALVIIVDDIEVSVLTAIGYVVFPVIYRVTPYIYISAMGADEISINLRMVYARIAADVVCKKVMMERGVLSSPDAAISVSTLAMDRVAEALGKETPLHSEILVGIE